MECPDSIKLFLDGTHHPKNHLQFFLVAPVQNLVYSSPQDFLACELMLGNQDLMNLYGERVGQFLQSLNARIFGAALDRTDEFDVQPGFPLAKHYYQKRALSRFTQT
jgi:hypothetical protein